MNAVGGFMAGSIVAKLLLDKTGWNESIKSVDQDTKELSQRAMKLGDAFTDVGKKFAVVGGLITGSLLAMVKKTADAGDAIFDMSQRTGVAAETLSAYKLAAEKSGATLESLATGFRGLAGRMLDTKNGLLESKRAFDTLGISVMDASGNLRPMNDVLLEVADKFAAMEDGTLKAALAQDLFGRSGMALIPMLNLGAQGLRQEADLAKKLGIVFDKDAASAADKFNDALAELKASVAGVGITIGTALMPPVKALVGFFTGMISGVNNIARENSALTRTVTQLALSFGGAATIVGTFVVAVGTAIKVLATLAVTLGTTRAALMLSVGAWTAAATAVGYYIIKLGEVHEAEAMADTANENYWQTYERFRMKLLEIAKAAGLNVYQFNELTAKYGENINMLALAIKRGDEGVVMQEAMAKAGAKNVKEFERQRQEAFGLTGILDGLNAAVDGVSAGMKKMAAETIDATEAFAKMAAENIDELVTWLSPEATESLVDEFIAMGAELSAEATKAAKGVKKAFGTLPDYFAGLYNDIANGFANAFERLFEGMSDADKKRKAQLQQSMKDITDAYKAGEISLEEYTEKYKAAYDEMQGITSGFARFFKDIWQTIKQAFFKVIGEMVAKFVVGFVQNIIAGMGIVKAATTAFNAFSAAAGTAATGTAQAVTTGAAGATGAAAGAGAALGMAATAGFLAVWTPMFIGAISGIFNFNKPKSKEQLQAELDWIEALKLKWRTEGRTEDWITNQLKNLDWWKSEPGTRGAVGQPDRRWATGFEGIITTPTTALFGEAGPEYVSVQPMTGARPAMAMAGAGGTGSAMVTLNMNGPLISTTGVSRQDLEAASEQFVLMVQRQLRRVGRTI